MVPTISSPGESGLACEPSGASLSSGRPACACRGRRTTDARGPRPLRRFGGCSDTVARDRLRRAAPRRESPHGPFRRGAAEPSRLRSAAAARRPGRREFARRRQLTTGQSPTPREPHERVGAAILRFRSWSITRIVILRTVCRESTTCISPSARDASVPGRRPRHPGACPTCRTTRPVACTRGIVAQRDKRLSPQRFTCDCGCAPSGMAMRLQELAAVEGDHADANDFDSCNPALCRHRRTGGRPDDLAPGQARAGGGASHRASGRHQVEVQLRRRLGHLRVCQLAVSTTRRNPASTKT